LLSKLPREIRAKIWREVLGDSVLHLYQSDYTGKSFALGIEPADEEDQAFIHLWKLSVCDKPKSLPQLYELSKTPLGTEPIVGPGYELNEEHWNGLSEAEKKRSIRYARKEELCHRDCQCIESLFGREYDNYHPQASQRRKSKAWVGNLALLQTCRMVYHEANHCLWSRYNFCYQKSFSALSSELLRHIFPCCEIS